MNRVSESFVNLAAYHFVRLDDLETRRDTLRTFCKSLNLRGTILLAPEGINLFVSGTREATSALMTKLRQDEAFREIEVKESVSREIAFNRMLVKIKREIIAFGVEGIEPGEYTAPRISATELKQWLDEDRELVLLDVRNEFECALGTFSGAETAKVDSFRDFPAAVESLPDEWKSKPVVTFCTGGIRCEKAAPLMEQAGFQNVLQLDGGILKYFEECGGEHYDGECFVFDRRVSLDHELHETDASLCFNCQKVLRTEDRRSERYEEGISCPFCYDEQESEIERVTKRRLKSIRRFQSKLPGVEPYRNVRPLNMPGRVEGMTLGNALQVMFPSDPPEEWMERVSAGRIQLGEKVAKWTDRVVGGQSFIHVESEFVEPWVDANIEIIEEDEEWLVVNKPAPLPVHPCGRFHRHTLTWMLGQADRATRLRPAHRLDANTSGVQILCKSRESAQILHSRFADGAASKTYLARICGRPAESEWESNDPISDASGPNGQRVVSKDGRPAKTRFRLIGEFEDGSSLLIAEPMTGRTNQIRVHLWHAGLPIQGDPMYLTDRKLAAKQTLDYDDQPMCLHAWKLEIEHPKSQETRSFEARRPDWA